MSKPLRQACPDGGTCREDCPTPSGVRGYPCARVLSGRPLPYFGTHWSPDRVAYHRAEADRLREAASEPPLPGL